MLEFEIDIAMGVVLIGGLLALMSGLGNEREAELMGVGVMALGVALLWLTRL